MQTIPDRIVADSPCVWVSAGVLSYRPCDREYDCERCPLYQALRGGDARALAASDITASPSTPDSVEDLAGRYLAELGAGCRLHLDRAYSAEGLWLSSERAGAIDIGLDDYTLRLLQPLDDVVLPRPGVWLAHLAPCAWVNRGRLAIALRCPVAGEVVAVHPRPTLTLPQSGDGAGADDRWWFRIKPHEPVAAAGGLYRNEALLNWFLGRVRNVHEQVSAVMTPPSGLAGPALADGGRPARNLEVVIGRERFEALVGRLFPRHV